MIMKLHRATLLVAPSSIQKFDNDGNVFLMFKNVIQHK